MTTTTRYCWPEAERRVRSRLAYLETHWNVWEDFVRYRELDELLLRFIRGDREAEKGGQVVSPVLWYTACAGRCANNKIQVTEQRRPARRGPGA